MSLHYNFQAVTSRSIPSLYDLGKAKVVAFSTCNAIYNHQPIQTDTLARILEYTDCPLENFLHYEPDTDSPQSGKHSLDLKDMVLRGVISRTSQKRFDTGQTMSLSTLCVIAKDQGVNLLDFLHVETRLVASEGGILKKEKKVIYLTEW